MCSLASTTKALVAAAALARARASAESNGRDGEVLISIRLQHELAAGHIRSFRWVSEENAIAPWDFEIVEAGGTPVRIGTVVPEPQGTPGARGKPLSADPAERLDLGGGSCGCTQAAGPDRRLLG